jgi:hypothetical protein
MHDESQPSEGWLDSAVFDRELQFAQQPNQLSHPQYPHPQYTLAARP